MLKLGLIGNKKLFSILKNHTESKDLEVTFCSPKQISISDNYDFFKSFDVIITPFSVDIDKKTSNMKILNAVPYHFSKLNMIPRYFDYDSSLRITEKTSNDIEDIKHKLIGRFKNNLPDIYLDFKYSLFVMNYHHKTAEYFKSVTEVNFFEFIVELQSKIKTKILFSFKQGSENFPLYSQLLDFCKYKKDYVTLPCNIRPVQYIKQAEYSFSLNSNFVFESIMAFNKPAFFIKNIKNNLYDEGEIANLLNNTEYFKKFYIHHENKKIYIPHSFCNTLSNEDIFECNNWLYQHIHSAFREGMYNNNTTKIDELIRWIKTNANFGNENYINPPINFSELRILKSI